MTFVAPVAAAPVAVAGSPAIANTSSSMINNMADNGSANMQRKVVGGMPQTQASLGLLGAGTPYGS